jgi:hypothetical protein
MPLGYGYVDREADSYVDWASVGKDFSDMFAEVNRSRAEKKDAIAQATRESLNELANTPQGENITANQEALRFSKDGSEKLRIMNRLLKSGEVSVEDYTIFKQNLDDGTNLGFNAMRAYQTEFARKMKRKNDGVSSEWEQSNMAKAEGHGNFTQAGLYIGADGNVYSALKTKKNIDGKEVYTMDAKPGSIMGVRAINQLILGDYDKYDYVPVVDSIVEKFGNDQQISVLKENGFFATGIIQNVDDITKRTSIGPEKQKILFDYLAAEDGVVKTITGNVNSTTSILLDQMKFTNGSPFTIVDDPADVKGPNQILRVTNKDTGELIPQLTKEQITLAENFIRDQVRLRLDVKSEYTSTGQIDKQYQPVRNNPGGPGPSSKKEKPEPFVDQTYSVIKNKIINGIKIQDGSRSFPVTNLTLGDTASEKDVNATNFIVSPGGKIYLQITTPNYTKTGAVDEFGDPITSGEPVTSLLDFGKDTSKIGRFANRFGMTLDQFTKYAINLVEDDFITTPNERGGRSTKGKSGKTIVKP